MGCCLATTANRRQPDKSKLKSEPTTHATSHSFSPAFEEETVKEVLSETPIIVPKTPPPVLLDRPEIIQPEDKKTESEPGGRNPTDEIQEKENVSEMSSEMYIFSESFSATTTATVSASVAENKKEEIEMDDDGEVNQKVKTKSPSAKRVTRKRRMVSSGEVSGRKEKVVRPPPARKQMVPSPEKKRQSPSRMPTNAQRHWNVEDGRREVTARRSRSPAVRGEAGQRRKDRGRSPVEKSGDVMPVKDGECVERSTVEKVDDGGVSPEPEVQTNESLENPLVSLECFIFL